MKYIRICFLIFLGLIQLEFPCFALETSSKVIKRFKALISECSNDALKIDGEYKNNGYYVNLSNGLVKNFTFLNTLIKFENLNEAIREQLLNVNCSFDKLRNMVKIKFASEIDAREIQQVLDFEISKPATSRRVFSEAEVTLYDSYANIKGLINMKKIPGNPMAFMISDEFVPFSADLNIMMNGSELNLVIKDGEINSQVINDDLKVTLLNWLNPLFDFSKLDFDCSVKELKIENSRLKILGTVF